ncbi:unnamed protein product [Angiostrongylus costaricensis]|uniref:Transposase n=1 Tax=Angiostrongylus costaricensis TaxID=334426 RepID=A0A0R3PQH2_ANGCS|nr:unnamed protein product [Angiostrongylus costaricensis]
MYVGIEMLSTVKKWASFPDLERALDFAALGRKHTGRLLKSQDRWKLPGLQRTMMMICAYNARTLASESAIEGFLMQARTIRYDVTGLAETRRRHPYNAVYDTGEELFLGTCDSRGVGGVVVSVNTSLAMDVDSFEQLTAQIGRLRLKGCESLPALTFFVVYAPTSNYDERRSRSIPYGLGEILQGRPYILQGHHWRFPTSRLDKAKRRQNVTLKPTD